MAAIWKCISAEEAIESLNEGTLRDIVPDSPGLYLWRRRVIHEPQVASTQEACAKWLYGLASTPTAVLGERPVSHCLKLQGMIIGGGGITADKEETLSVATEKRGMRNHIVDLMASLTRFMPPIYIGEASNLQTRIKQHLRGETELKSYVEDGLGLSWDDMEIHFHELKVSAEVSTEVKKTLELLELIVQRSLSPFGTQRPG